MSEYDSGPQKPTDDSRTDPLDTLEFDETAGKRATHEALDLRPRDGYVLVRNESHADPSAHEYHVTVADDVPTSCTCPAYEYHCTPGEACKHMVAVALADPVREAASPAAVATDGGHGVIEASDGGEILDENDDRETTSTDDSGDDVADGDDTAGVPAGYEREDTPEPRWTHSESGLRVELVRKGRVGSRTMTHAAGGATGSDDTTWTLSVRPDGPRGYAEIYEPLAGTKQAALQAAREWMHAHPEGELAADETEGE